MDRNEEQLRIDKLRNYSITEIITTIPYDLAVAIDLHQQNDIRTHQAPTDFCPANLAEDETYAKAADTLTNNTGMYDDDLEDLIYEDGLLLELIAQQGTESRDPVLAAAVRARRTILARLLVEGPIPQPNPDSDVTQTT